jgi:hypothetical protein
MDSKICTIFKLILKFAQKHSSKKNLPVKYFKFPKFFVEYPNLRSSKVCNCSIY